MKKIDILARIHDGSITSDEAWSIHDSIIYDGVVNFQDVMMLTLLEHRAFCHGVNYDELSRWRYGGWPSTCQICGREIDINREHWLARSKEENAPFGLAHIACLPVSRESKEGEK